MSDDFHTVNLDTNVSRPGVRAVQRTRYIVECYVHPSQSLFHMSLVHAGLVGLAESGDIELTYRCSKPVPDVGSPPWMSWLVLREYLTGESRIIHLDLADRSDELSLPSLADCDVYFKRSFYSPDLAALPEHLRKKMEPFGLNFACRSKASTRLVLSRIVPLMGFELCRSPRKLLRWGRRDLDNVRAFLGTLPIEDYEQPPSQPVDPVVMFQTRLWSPAEMETDVEEQINRPRVELVRRLKKEFGTKFRGGVVATAHATRYYSDAVTNLPTRRSDYIALSKRALIGVYTRGLHDSSAFKLSEYLAASKCVVAEGLRNESPSPVVADRHYLSFASPDECVHQCIRLLENCHMAQEMRERNWDYYESEVRPTRLVANRLQRAFERQRD